MAFTQDVYMHAIPRIEEAAAQQLADLNFNQARIPSEPPLGIAADHERHALFGEHSGGANADGSDGGEAMTSAVGFGSGGSLSRQQHGPSQRAASPDGVSERTRLPVAVNCEPTSDSSAMGSPS